MVRAETEASQQGLTLHKRANGRWELGSLEGTETLLSGGRLRLPDGREVARELTLDQVEAFLARDRVRQPEPGGEPR